MDFVGNSSFRREVNLPWSVNVINLVAPGSFRFPYFCINNDQDHFTINKRVVYHQSSIVPSLSDLQSFFRLSIQQSEVQLELVLPTPE